MKKKGFTLVELLAVIVILAVILVIAIPQIMNVVKTSRVAAVESTARLVLKKAEEQLVENEVLGSKKAIRCSDLVKLSDEYSICSVSMDENNEPKVVVKGSDGRKLSNILCKGTKDNITLAITKAPLTITAVNKSKVFRQANPTLTVSYTGFKGSESYSVLTTQPTITTTASTDSPVSGSPYAINASGAAATNYDITYVPGQLTITPKSLTTATVTLDSDHFDFDNYEHKPTVTSVKDGEVTLDLNDEYTVAFTSKGEYGNTDHKAPDIYYADISFTGNYSGSYKQPYQIRKNINLADTWVTYYESDVNMQVPDGFSAYTITAYSNTAVTLTQQSFVKKGVPMVLYKNGDTSSFFPTLVGPTNAGNWTSNAAFRHVDVATDISTLLQDGYSIWILVDGQFVRTKSGTLPAGKCYLKLSNSQVNASRIDLSNIYTGIENKAKENLKDSYWYTIDGRRLQSPPTQKGIYIVNGKKVVIK